MTIRSAPVSVAYWRICCDGVGVGPVDDPVVVPDVREVAVEPASLAPPRLGPSPRTPGDRRDPTADRYRSCSQRATPRVLVSFHYRRYRSVGKRPSQSAKTVKRGRRDPARESAGRSSRRHIAHPPHAGSARCRTSRERRARLYPAQRRGTRVGPEGRGRYCPEIHMCHPSVPRTSFKSNLERRLRMEYPERYATVMNATVSQQLYRWARSKELTQPLHRVLNWAGYHCEPAV